MFEWLKPKKEIRSQTTEETTTSSDVISWQAVGAELQGQVSNPAYYESLSAVFSCVDLISSSLASCPAYVYTKDYKSKIEDETDSLARLIRYGVNAYQTWHDFIEFMMRQVLLRGNAVAHIIYNKKNGKLEEIRPYPWEWCYIEILKKGKIRYTVTDNLGLYGEAGSKKVILQQDMLHIKDSSDLPYIGKSRISRASKVFSTALTTQDFSASIYQQGVRPGGALCCPDKIDANVRESLKEDVNKFYSGANVGRAMVLENGMRWEPYVVNSEDQQILESRQFSVEEIARLFAVPPPLIGDLRHGTFQNSETAGRWFYTYCLSGWANKLEAEINRTCLDERHLVSIDLSSIMKGDHASRWAGYCQAVANGILTRNEIREMEGWNPLDKDGNEEF